MTENTTASGAADALLHLLDAIQTGRFVPAGPESIGYCKAAVQAAERALAASAPVAPTQPLTIYEQQRLLRHPEAIRIMMDLEDLAYTEAEPCVEPGDLEPWPTKRWLELRELGRVIVAEDPELWSVEVLDRFGFLQAAPPSQPVAPVAPAPQPETGADDEVADYGHDTSAAYGYSTPYYCGMCGDHVGDVASPKQVPKKKDSRCWKCSEMQALAAAPKAPAQTLLADAAQRVVREALDAVEVHPCDVNNDSIRAKGLHGPMAALHAALAAPLKTGDLDRAIEALHLAVDESRAVQPDLALIRRSLAARGFNTFPGDDKELVVSAANVISEDWTVLQARSARGAAQAAPADQRNTKTHDLLSTMIGLFMGQRHKIGYKDNSVIAKVVAEAVEHLKDWPYPEAAPAPVAEDAERLDYLQTGSTVSLVVGRNKSLHFQVGGLYRTENPSIRAAIDIARAQAAQPEGGAK